MKAYQSARAEAEANLRAARLPTTILRPWYVLGPGHRWPYLLLPVYRFCEWSPRWRAGAQRLGLVTLDQMSRTLVHAVENPVKSVRIIEVPEIREIGGTM
jgi:uncharacterized protein YbjT (DUF2867 family)